MKEEIRVLQKTRKTNDCQQTTESRREEWTYFLHSPQKEPTKTCIIFLTSVTPTNAITREVTPSPTHIHTERKEPTSLTHWSWTSGFHHCEIIHFYCLSHIVVLCYGNSRKLTQVSNMHSRPTFVYLIFWTSNF